MTLSTRHLPPGPGFWPDVAQQLVADAGPRAAARDLSAALVLVPAWHQASLLRRALATALGPSFIPPRIRTVGAWLSQYPPEPGTPAPASQGERLIALYASLRELGWLKKLFSARRNIDLMPLAQTLLSLCDELTNALLPAALAQPALVEDRWHRALAQLSPRAAALLSDEARLVWNLWQAERDARDPGIQRHAALQRAAAKATQPLYWCAPVPPDALEESFLRVYALKQPVSLLTPDWSPSAVPAVFCEAWPELVQALSIVAAQSAAPSSSDARETVTAARPAYPKATLAGRSTVGIRCYEAAGLEDEALCAAQTIVDWIGQGKSRIAIVPQDRVVARRVRALLERAQVAVADETGWKLSTTRAAAVLHAWLVLAASGGEVAALLDFLKSPFLFDDDDAAAMQRAAIESALLAAGIPAGWPVLLSALSPWPEVSARVEAVAREAQRCSGRKTMSDWVITTRTALDALGIVAGMAADTAGAQVLAMLDQIQRDSEQIDERFSLAEWRALVDLHLEQTVFVAPRIDQRVMMVPLNGTALREFDAAILVGADSDHLPSRPAETLFFANAVRRELGLATREGRQQQQLREFTALLISCPEVVLSWQGWRGGERNAPSAWLQRLELNLTLLGAPALPRHAPTMPTATLAVTPAEMPRPSAPALMPARLSASGYNSLVACPYQFFGSRMLKLSATDELTDIPQKRDYGEWLHQILKRYHDRVHQEAIPPEQREVCMAAVSDAVFADVLQKNPAALGYQSRWQKLRTAYVRWSNAHEADGWRFESGEQWEERLLSWERGEVTLIGQIDRIDSRAAGERLVLDYKSARKEKLGKRLRNREDHQLPFYGLLLDPPPSAAAYLAIDDETPALIDADDFGAWRSALQALIVANWEAISQGAGLPASGTPGSCDRCDLRGLCRKGVW